MCGLAGLSYHPSTPATGPVLTSLMSRLLDNMASRGRHATGLAIGGGQAAVIPLIRKLALPAPVFTASEAYRTAVDLGLAMRSPIWMGHTRHATHNNAHLDEAAHPFRQGNVVGAHNGIISNWHRLLQEVRPDPAWTVDSQAAFALLDQYANANTALDKLQGYWALTWIKRNRLYACRTDDAQLSFGYLPRLRLLVWASTAQAIRDAVRATVPADQAHGFQAWGTEGNTLYEFDPDEFTEEGPQHVVAQLTFAGRGRSEWDTSLTDERALARAHTQNPAALTGPVEQIDLPVLGPGGPMVVRSQAYTGPARQVDPGIGKGQRRPGKRRPGPSSSLSEGTSLARALTPAGQFELLWETIRVLQRRVQDLETLTADQDRELKLLRDGHVPF
jgi:hypothetical protein